MASNFEQSAANDSRLQAAPVIREHARGLRVSGAPLHAPPTAPRAQRCPNVESSIDFLLAGSIADNKRPCKYDVGDYWFIDSESTYVPVLLYVLHSCHELCEAKALLGRCVLFRFQMQVQRALALACYFFLTHITYVHVYTLLCSDGHQGIN